MLGARWLLLKLLEKVMARLRQQNPLLVLKGVLNDLVNLWVVGFCKFLLKLKLLQVEVGLKLKVSAADYLKVDPSGHFSGGAHGGAHMTYEASFFACLSNWLTVLCGQSIVRFGVFLVRLTENLYAKLLGLLAALFRTCFCSRRSLSGRGQI